MSGIGTTLTTGIQNISALLPLLGTAQCEDHSGSSLTGGYLYAAASPMSIFGSLGVASAGFKALLASISIPRWGFFGAEKLRDAGFQPSGKNLSLIMMDPAHIERHLAETRMDSLLKTLQIDALHIQDISRLTIMTTCFQWNIQMLCVTVMTCSLGVVPYLHLNLDSSDHRLDPFARWAFPIARVLGGFLTAISLQFLIQQRLLVILKKRLIFHALNTKKNSSLIHSYHPSLPWALQTSSELCLSSLDQLVRRTVERHQNIARISPPYIRKFLANRKNHAIQSTASDKKSRGGSRRRNNDDIHDHPTPRIRPPSDLESARNPSGQLDLETLGKELEKANEAMFPQSDPWGPIVRLLMALGLVASIVGYIGCFSVVQAARRSLGPTIWLLLEVILSIFRMGLWGWNPPWDDIEHIEISFELDSHPPISTCNKSSDEIFDDKLLPLIRAPEFLSSIQAYAGFLKHFHNPDISVYYTLTRRSAEPPGIFQRVLFITIVNQNTRAATVYYEDEKHGVHFFDATNPTTNRANKDVLQTEIGSVSGLETLTISQGEASALSEHYQSILKKLRDREGDHSVLIDEINMDWMLSDHSAGSPRMKKGQQENQGPDVDIMHLKQGDLQRKRRHRSASQRGWLDCFMSEVETETHNELNFWPSGTPPPSPTIVMRHETLMLERFGLESLFLHEIRTWEDHLWRGHKELLDKVGNRMGNSTSVNLATRLRNNWAVYARERLAQDRATTANRLAEAEKKFIASLAGVSNVEADTLTQAWRALQVSVEAEWQDIIQNCEKEAALSNHAPLVLSSPRSPAGVLARCIEKYTTTGRETFRRTNGRYMHFYNYLKKERERRLGGEAKDVEGWINRGLPNCDAALGCIEGSIIPNMVISSVKWRLITHQTVQSEGIAPLSRALQRNSHISFIEFSSFPSSDQALATTIRGIIPTTTSSLTTISMPHCKAQIGAHTITALRDIIEENSGVRSIFANDSTLDWLRSDSAGPLPNRFGQQANVSFTFHGYRAHSSELMSGGGSKIEVHFLGPMYGRVRLALSHRSRTNGLESSGTTLALTVNHKILQPHWVAPATQAQQESLPMLSPVTDFNPGTLNLITITTSGSDYVLSAIDLVDENGIPFGCEADPLPYPLFPPEEPSSASVPPFIRPDPRNMRRSHSRSPRRLRSRSPHRSPLPSPHVAPVIPPTIPIADAGYESPTSSSTVSFEDRYGGPPSDENVVPFIPPPPTGRSRVRSYFQHPGTMRNVQYGAVEERDFSSSNRGTPRVDDRRVLRRNSPALSERSSRLTRSRSGSRSSRASAPRSPLISYAPPLDPVPRGRRRSRSASRSSIAPAPQSRFISPALPSPSPQLVPQNGPETARSTPAPPMAVIDPMQHSDGHHDPQSPQPPAPITIIQPTAPFPQTPGVLIGQHSVTSGPVNLR